MTGLYKDPVQRNRTLFMGLPILEVRICRRQITYEDIARLTWLFIAVGKFLKELIEVLHRI
jgi:hypothetical protein